MKTIIDLFVLIFLLVAGANPCFAMISVENVSKKRAEELGVTFQTSTNGEAGTRVTLKFKFEGELKQITYVQLQIGEKEDRIMSAPLLVSNPNPSIGSVTFSADPAYLPKSSLMIVVYHGPKGDVGYNFKIKDFIQLEKLR